MAGNATRRGVAVLAHGSGSTGEFVHRALGPALAARGWLTVAVEDRTGEVGAVQTAIEQTVRRTGARLVGGVSLGAHAAARWAAERGPDDLDGLLLVLPAWTGPPGEVASASAASAPVVEEVGGAEAGRLARDGSWVGEELARAWPTYGTGLAPALRATAGSPGPDLAHLRSLDVPTGVVGLLDDPFHPVEVAREWADALRSGGYVELSPRDPARDRSTIGRAALAALAAARSVSGSR
jgi:hypothetical protein